MFKTRMILILALSFIVLLSLSCSLPGMMDPGHAVKLDGHEWSCYTNTGSGWPCWDITVWGSTTLGRLTVQTIGDGLISETDIPIENGRFSNRTGYSFLVNTLPSGTIIRGYLHPYGPLPENLVTNVNIGGAE